jgi:hypothetical protein
MKMSPTLPGYPATSEFITALGEREDTFLYDRLDTADYGFWPHLEHFLLNIKRFGNHESIIKRLSLDVPLEMNIQQAWGKWQQFRSAQSEVTSIFIIENYFKGQVLGIIPVNKKPTSDIKVSLANKEYLIEIKAQSGQQHGTKHPRAKGSNLFSPDDELDLKSWLFEENISIRNGKPMKPKTIEADEKGAEILMAMTDHFTTIHDIKEQVSILCPGNKFIETKVTTIEKRQPCVAHFYEVTFPVKSNLINLKEIWLYNESHFDRFLVLSRESILIYHLNNIR